MGENEQKEDKMYSKEDLTYLVEKLLGQRFSKSDIILIAQSVSAEVKKDMKEALDAQKKDLESSLVSEVTCITVQTDIKNKMQRLTVVSWASLAISGYALGIKIWDLATKKIFG